jgi:membrane-bound ClpP family serine protease
VTDLVIWGMILLGAAVIIIIVEMFVPTAGALSVMAGVAAIAGIVCMFKADTVWGLSSLLAVLILIPAALTFGLRIWPSTPLGRRIIGAPSEEELEKQRLTEEKDRKQRDALIGAEGIVLQDLRPIGVVEVNGRRYDARAESRFIQTGSRIRVVQVDGLELKVRQLT